MSMDKQKTAFLNMWGKERQKGKWKYILTNSLIVFFLLNVVTAVLNFRALNAGDYSELTDYRRVGMYMVASLLIVLFRWRRNERLYKRFTEEAE